jgi:hypothetical protein
MSILSMKIILNIRAIREKYHKGKTLKESKEISPPLFPELIYLILKWYLPAGRFVYSLKLICFQLLHSLSNPSRKN